MKRELKKLVKETRYAVKVASRVLKRWHKKIPANELEPLAKALGEFRAAVKKDDIAAARVASKQLEDLLETEFRFARKSTLREWVESLGAALIIALFLRSFVLEAFKIPSGSMIPTLLVGDHIFVNKFIYGVRLPIIGKRIIEWGNPERGEVIVFAYPHDPDKDYIKRVIGIPGDRILVKDHEVYVNGKRVVQSRGEPLTYVDDATGMNRQAIHHFAALGNAQFSIIYEPKRSHASLEYVVEEGHVFVMGDNRDNSADSRAWGQVPFENIKGRAMVVWWSSSDREGIRLQRIGHLID